MSNISSLNRSKRKPHLSLMDISKYQAKFLGFQAELSSFLFRLLTNRQNTEDLVQDTYLKTFEKLHTFQHKSTFKTWVFAIATNLAKNKLKKQNRWAENTQDYGAQLHVQSPSHWDKFHAVFDTTPDRQYEIKEHINYCFNCINKTLVLNQQVCLLLKEVYAFKISEIVHITHLTEGKVKHALADARKNMTRIFNDRCSFVNKKGVCHQCTELTGILNPNQNAHIEANKIKLVQKGASSDNSDYLLQLRLDLVQHIDPLNSPNSSVNSFMLENCENWLKEGKSKKVL